eukprot:m.47807 g.47807  ORF g.47807 m.47807 type:complete len:57 (+) comp7359_c0_seq5:43-213(+)
MFNRTHFLVFFASNMKEVAKYLASRGANVMKKCYNGWNAVMGAVYWDELCSYFQVI